MRQRLKPTERRTRTDRKREPEPTTQSTEFRANSMSVRHGTDVLVTRFSVANVVFANPRVWRCCRAHGCRPC